MIHKACKAINFEIGKVCFSIKTQHPSIRLRVLEHYQGYLSKSHPHILIEVIYRRSLKKPVFKKAFISGPTWRLGRRGNVYLLVFPGQGSVSFAEINLTFNRVKFYTQDPSGQLLLYLLPEILSGVILPQNNALLIHACGVSVNAKGYLFIAASGGGKSTIAKLALESGLKVLNDDRMIIRRRGSLFKMYGNPWHGEVEVTAADSLDINGVFFLQKGLRHKLKLLNVKQAALGLVRNSFYLPINYDILKTRLSICHKLAQFRKCYLLDFKIDKTIWRFLDERS